LNKDEIRWGRTHNIPCTWRGLHSLHRVAGIFTVPVTANNHYDHLVLFSTTFGFYPRDVVSRVFATATCLTVCPSVRLSQPVLYQND